MRAAFLPSEPTNYNAQLPVYISPPRGEGEGEDDAALPADMERAYRHAPRNPRHFVIIEAS